MKKVNLEIIKTLRKKAGLTQGEVSKLLGYKTTLGYHYIESGRCSLRVEHAHLLAQIYSVSIENFFEDGITSTVINGLDCNS